MEIVVRLDTDEVAMSMPEDLRRFSVVIQPAGWPDAVVAATRILAAKEVGRLNPAGDTAFVREAAVRDLANSAFGDVVPTSWANDFLGMVEYARTKGWIADDGAVQAHVEWRDGEGRVQF